jgi:hypothetical protein
MVVQTLKGQIAVAQNGNLTTAKSLKQILLQKGIGMFRTSDVEVFFSTPFPPFPLPPSLPLSLFPSPSLSLSLPLPLNKTQIITQLLAANPVGTDSDKWEARISSFMQQADGGMH